MPDREETCRAQLGLQIRAFCCLWHSRETCPQTAPFCWEGVEVPQAGTPSRTLGYQPRSRERWELPAPFKPLSRRRSLALDIGSDLAPSESPLLDPSAWHWWERQGAASVNSHKNSPARRTKKGPQQGNRASACVHVLQASFSSGPASALPHPSSHHSPPDTYPSTIACAHPPLPHHPERAKEALRSASAQMPQGHPPLHSQMPFSSPSTSL